MGWGQGTGLYPREQPQDPVGGSPPGGALDATLEGDMKKELPLSGSGGLCGEEPITLALEGFFVGFHWDKQHSLPLPLPASYLGQEKSLGFGGQNLGLAWLCGPIAMCSWASHRTSPSLRLFLCKKRNNNNTYRVVEIM